MPMPEHTMKSKKLSKKKKIVALTTNSLQENKLHRREEISEELRTL